MLARYVVGHPRPFFAPIATVTVLGITLGQRTRRAIQIAVGVALGILVADLAVQLIGTGAWQLAVILFVGMMRRRLPRAATSSSSIQAANAARADRGARDPGRPDAGSSRFVDVLIGATHGARLQPRAVPGQPA